MTEPLKPNNVNKPSLINSQLSPLMASFAPDKLLQNLATAVMVLDKQLNVVFCNDAGCHLLGQSAKRVNQLHFSQVFRHFSLPLSRIEQVIEQQTELSDGEVHGLLLDSRAVILSVHCSTMTHQGHLYGLLEFRQIDKRHQIIHETHADTQYSVARNLVRGLAHEIKNPLGGIRGAAQLLQRQLNNNDLKEYTELVIEQSDRLRDLVDKLLGPNEPPNFQPHNIHRVLDKTLKLITIEEHNTIKVIRDYDPSIPEIAIDEQLIQQALLNIFRNATQAMNRHDQSPELKVRTRIKHHHSINGRHHKIALNIEICDNGPGISAKLMDTLFFPMISGQPQGTGLGLSISQTLLHQHDGRIDCTSAPNNTRFCLLIPFREVNNG